MRLDEPPDDDEAGADVIELRPGQDAADDDRHMVTKRKTYGPCRHKRITLDRDVQRAYCRRCDVEVPLFDYLVSLAEGWERFISERREAARRMEVARANLAELLADERRAKARRRTWRKHEPEAVQHLRALAGLCGQLAGRGHPVVDSALTYLRGDDEDARPEVDSAA